MITDVILHSRMVYDEADWKAHQAQLDKDIVESCVGAQFEVHEKSPFNHGGISPCHPAKFPFLANTLLKVELDLHIHLGLVPNHTAEADANKFHCTKMHQFILAEDLAISTGPRPKLFTTPSTHAPVGRGDDGIDMRDL